VEKELGQKVAQLLEVEEVKSIYDRLMKNPRIQERILDPVFMLAFLLVRYVEGPDMRTLENDYDLLIKDVPQEDRQRIPLDSPGNIKQAITRIDRYVKQTDLLFTLIEIVFDKALELHAAGKLIITWPAGLEAEEILNDYEMVANSPVHYNFRNALARGQFFDNEQGWPAADISGKTFKGKAYFKDNIGLTTKTEALTELQEAMKEKVLGLGRHGDLCADVFDIIIAKWLQQARHEHDTVKIRADEFLLARGLKARLQKGKRGGFEDEQRKAIAEQIDYLDQAWVTVREMEVIRETDSGKRKKEKWREDRKALHIDGKTGQERLDGSLSVSQWEVMPGRIFAPFLFGPGRQTALLSCKALEYDFYRQKWEKRIARYLAWLWRINRGNKKEGLRVQTLLDAASQEIDQARPGRTRGRLEKALEQLQADGVITAWEYENFNDSITARRGWWQQWLESKVILTAPEELTQHYQQIEDKRQKQLKEKV
jgi:hypothetical protein